MTKVTNAENDTADTESDSEEEKRGFTENNNKK